MVERTGRRDTPLLLFVSLLLVAIDVVILWYGFGMFSSTSTQRVSTVTTTTTVTTTETPPPSSTTTITTTSTKTSITTTTTATTADAREQALRQHLAATNSSSSSSAAIIRERLLFNSSVLVMLSADKPVYRLGEVIHFKGTVTNLTPRSIELMLDFPQIKVRNSSQTAAHQSAESIWQEPEVRGGGGLGVMWNNRIWLGPEQTVFVDEFTADWNMTEFKTVRNVSEQGGITTYYGNFPVPPGQYAAYWYVYTYTEGFIEAVFFEITK